jgi:CubicO group peptidase (beta-lactamase class C family)
MASAVLLAGTVFAHAQSLASRPAGQEGLSTDRLAALDRRFQAGVEAGEIPGAVVMIARNGHLIYERAFGFASRADRTPMTTGTLFRLASMTKPVTSVATMQLAEQGRLTLHDPLPRTCRS